MAGMTLLAADQLDWYVGKPWAMIIDVRNRREYEKGHVKGAVKLFWALSTTTLSRPLTTSWAGITGSCRGEMA